MGKEGSHILEQFETFPRASEEALQNLSGYFEATFGASVPASYVDFLRVSNGAIGHGPNLFVIIASAEDVIQKEKGYGQDEREPDLFHIGSDGCGNGLGIDTRCKNPEVMPFIMYDPIGLSGLDDPDAVQMRASSFLELLTNLAY